jgi:hypothetical protein
MRPAKRFRNRGCKAACSYGRPIRYRALIFRLAKGERTHFNRIDVQLSDGAE